MTTPKEPEILHTDSGDIELTKDMLVMLNMSRIEFIETNQAYLKEIGEEFFSVEDKDANIKPLDCPLHLWMIYNNAKCANEFISNTAMCPLCNNPVCPTCMNHNVHQISRVTGYLSDVTKWNSAKKQEFKDRHRYNLSGTNTR